MSDIKILKLTDTDFNAQGVYIGSIDFSEPLEGSIEIEATHKLVVFPGDLRAKGDISFGGYIKAGGGITRGGTP